MYYRLATLIALFTVFSATFAQEDQEPNIFSIDSLFMQGFESGYLLKKRQQTIEEFGCSVPQDLKVANDRAAKAYDIVFKIFETTQNMIDFNPIIDEAINMILIKIDGIYKFIAVLSPHNDIDEYCTGMIFGMYGSNGMIKIANRMINPKLNYEIAQSRFGDYKIFQENKTPLRTRIGNRMRK